MGLLDAVLGAVGGSQGGVQGQLLNAVVGMLTQGGGGAAGGAAGGGMGGLAGMLGQLTQAGLGDQVKSWVGTGQNMPVSADQLSQAMGGDTMGKLAQQMGLGQGEVAGHLSQLLPQLIDKLTPDGQVPQAGAAGGLGDLAGMLGGLLKR
jgi:uncharacterized protein YidB (DUF937 family)